MSEQKPGETRPRRNGDASTQPSEPSNAIRAFQLSGQGLERLLGSLEAELLEQVWVLTPGTATDPSGWSSVHDICRALGPQVNYKTVQTVLNRLVEKGLLERRNRTRPHTYRASVTRDELVAAVTRAILHGLVTEFGDQALAQLVQTADAISPEHRAILEQLTALPENDTDDDTEVAPTGSPARDERDDERSVQPRSPSGRRLRSSQLLSSSPVRDAAHEEGTDEQ